MGCEHTLYSKHYDGEPLGIVNGDESLSVSSPEARPIPHQSGHPNHHREGEEGGQGNKGDVERVRVRGSIPRELGGISYIEHQPVIEPVVRTECFCNLI